MPRKIDKDLEARVEQLLPDAEEGMGVMPETLPVERLRDPEDGAIVETVSPHTMTREQIDLIKKTVAKDCTDDELKLFLYTAQRMGLDPLARQIYAVKRGNVMTIQTAIDGYRVTADRTGCYAPGKDADYLEENGRLIKATAYVKKLVAGVWHEVSASAYWDEYVQSYNGRPANNWAKMPHVMLAKCAEALALRRAFPAELGGVYTKEEMDQAETPASEPEASKPDNAVARAVEKRQAAAKVAPQGEAMKPESMNLLTQLLGNSCFNESEVSHYMGLVNKAPTQKRLEAVIDIVEKAILARTQKGA